MNFKSIDINHKNEYFYTVGLSNFINCEIKLKSFGNQGEVNLIHFLINYILLDLPIIKENETISYGLWLLKFMKNDAYFEIYELDNQFEKWCEGADNAIYYIELQKKLCYDEQLEFSLPLFTQKIVVSEGVIEGMRVQGVRYNEPENMSGWYLTTTKYNGDIRNMNVINLQDLIVHRKDLLQFLALPQNYAFEINENNNYHIFKTSSAGTTYT